MQLPTFNTFSFNENGFITEKITHKGYADRSVTKSKINRREGIKLLGTEYGEKQITLAGVVIKSSVSELQTSLDTMKKALVTEEGSLSVEQGRTFRATVESILIPDEHYNQSKSNWEVTFVSSDPFSTGSLLTATTTIPSGTTTFSGYVNVSGTFFNRPLIVYESPDGSGQTNVRGITISHQATGQSVTVSGFGNGLGLNYGVDVTVDYSNLIAYEGSSAKNNGGAFSRWEAGDNYYTVTFSGGRVGGKINVTYQPRYL